VSRPQAISLPGGAAPRSPRASRWSRASRWAPGSTRRACGAPPAERSPMQNCVAPLGSRGVLWTKHVWGGGGLVCVGGWVSARTVACRTARPRLQPLGSWPRARRSCRPSNPGPHPASGQAAAGTAPEHSAAGRVLVGLHRLHPHFGSHALVGDREDSQLASPELVQDKTMARNTPLHPRGCFALVGHAHGLPA